MGLNLGRPEKNQEHATLESDPAFKYVKLLKMGVPAAAVAGQMEKAGLDPCACPEVSKALTKDSLPLPPPKQDAPPRNLTPAELIIQGRNQMDASCPRELLLTEDDHSDLSFDPNVAWTVLGPSQTFVEPLRSSGGGGGDDVTKYPKLSSGNDDNDDITDLNMLRFVCISDTHGRHRGVAVPRGDVLVHSGDFSNVGDMTEIEDFADWLMECKEAGGFGSVLVIAGNHDITFDEPYYTTAGARRFHRKEAQDPRAARRILQDRPGITYLEDEAHELPNGTLVWGAPWQPEFCNWAFGLDRGGPLRAAWDRIPTDTDVLLTHGPPLGRGDACKGGHRAGCVDLLRTVQRRVVPRVHIFGHVHEGSGVTHDGNTSFVNASTCTFQYQSVNPAIVFDLPSSTTERRLPAVFLNSHLSEWSAEQVSNWLDTTLAAAAFLTDDDAMDDLAYYATKKTRIASVLRGATGAELLALTKEKLFDRIERHDRDHGDASGWPVKDQTMVWRTIRHLEAANF